MVDLDTGALLLSQCWQAIRDWGPESEQAQSTFSAVFGCWYALIWLLSGSNAAPEWQAEVRQATVEGLWRALCAATEPLSNPARVITLLSARAGAACRQPVAVAAVREHGTATATLEAPAPRRWEAQ